MENNITKLEKIKIINKNNKITIVKKIYIIMST